METIPRFGPLKGLLSGGLNEGSLCAMSTERYIGIEALSECLDHRYLFYVSALAGFSPASSLPFLTEAGT